MTAKEEKLMGKKVSVLGVKYTIEFHETAEDSQLEAGACGYCDNTAKIIVAASRDENCEVIYWDKKTNEILRHELVHAFLYEGGLDACVQNEEQGVSEMFVDWVAIQFPKLFKAYSDLDILD